MLSFVIIICGHFYVGHDTIMTFKKKNELLNISLEHYTLSSMFFLHWPIQFTIELYVDMCGYILILSPGMVIFIIVIN